jgi:hypothetical protein
VEIPSTVTSRCPSVLVPSTYTQHLCTCVCRRAQGRNLLSGDMLEYKPDENCDNAAATELKERSAEDPTLLLGWQVSLL